MCRTHWYMVPEHMRTDVWRSLHQYELRPVDRNRLLALRASQEMATAFVRALVQSRVIPCAADDSGDGPH